MRLCNINIIIYSYSQSLRLDDYLRQTIYALTIALRGPYRYEPFRGKGEFESLGFPVGTGAPKIKIAYLSKL